MLFSRLSLSLLATLPTRVFCDEYPVNANGNLVLQSTDVHISWGNHKPLDVLERLREKCPEDGIGCCKATNVELDTQVTIDGRSYMRTLSVTINEASYVPGATGGFSQLLKALQALVDSEPWTVFTSKVHWDQDTEQSSCTRNNNNYCWSVSEPVAFSNCKPPFYKERFANLLAPPSPEPGPG